MSHLIIFSTKMKLALDSVNVALVYRRNEG